MVSKSTVDEIEMMSEMGMSNSEIADALEVSEETIEEILEKNIVEKD
jgi:DNA-binding NarL/FixJ family response regulator